MELNREPNIYVMVGACKRGKSYLIKSILKELCDAKYFKFGIIVTSSGFTEDYDYMDPKAVWTYDQAKIETYITHLRKMTEEKKIQPNFLVLDDLLGKIDTNTPFWQNFLSTYRKTETSIFFASQYLKARGASNTLLREIADYSFMFRTMQKNSIHGLYEAFGQHYDSVDDFKVALMKATEQDYHTMCFVNNRNTIQESYKEFVAKPVDKFKLKF
jgi:hypothetical protein